MVIEAYSGKVLVASNASAKRPIASLTKIATGAVAVDWATATGADSARSDHRARRPSPSSAAPIR